MSSRCTRFSYAAVVVVCVRSCAVVVHISAVDTTFVHCRTAESRVGPNRFNLAECLSSFICLLFQKRKSMKADIEKICLFLLFFYLSCQMGKAIGYESNIKPKDFKNPLALCVIKSHQYSVSLSNLAKKARSHQDKEKASSSKEGGGSTNN